jgi:hypothetical protein
VQVKKSNVASPPLSREECKVSTLGHRTEAYCI